MMRRGTTMYRFRASPRLFRSLALLFMLGCFSLVQACSFIEHWDESGLACDSNIVNGRTNFCLAGYSCFNPTVTCIRDASRNLGQACTDTKQCQVDELCPIDNLTGTGIAQQEDVQTCLRKCQSTSINGGYYQLDGCHETNYYCAPFLDGVAALSTSGLIGGCVPTSDCSPGAYCTINSVAGGICVPISASANACITKCDITWSSTATYSDSCSNTQFCQPLGMTGAQQFVCLENTRNVQPDKAACSAVEAPCKKGSACSPLGTCAPYCELTGNTLSTLCGTNETCCPFSNYGSSQVSGYCAAACP